MCRLNRLKTGVFLVLAWHGIACMHGIMASWHGANEFYYTVLPLQALVFFCSAKPSLKSQREPASQPASFRGAATTRSLTPRINMTLALRL
jgi:hypothetical protein